MKTAFFLRSSSDGQASIYIRITEGRGDQFKFATGHAVLRPDHWNKTKQRVRNKVDAVGCDEVNVQLEKLQAFVRQAHLDAKTKGQRRDRDFYLQVIQDFKRGVERSSVGQTLTIGEAFERFIDHASKHNSPITGSRLSKGTLENYAVTLRQIQHVLMDSTTLDEVDMDWYHDFRLQERAERAQWEAIEQELHRPPHQGGQERLGRHGGTGARCPPRLPQEGLQEDH